MSISDKLNQKLQESAQIDEGSNNMSYEDACKLLKLNPKTDLKRNKELAKSLESHLVSTAPLRYHVATKVIMDECNDVNESMNVSDEYEYDETEEICECPEDQECSCDVGEEDEIVLQIIPEDANESDFVASLGNPSLKQSGFRVYAEFVDGDTNVLGVSDIYEESDLESVKQDIEDSGAKIIRIDKV